MSATDFLRRVEVNKTNWIFSLKKKMSLLLLLWMSINNWAVIAGEPIRYPCVYIKWHWRYFAAFGLWIIHTHLYYYDHKALFFVHSPIGRSSQTISSELNDQLTVSAWDSHIFTFLKINLFCQGIIIFFIYEPDWLCKYL